MHTKNPQQQPTIFSQNLALKTQPKQFLSQQILTPSSWIVETMKVATKQKNLSSILRVLICCVFANMAYAFFVFFLILGESECGRRRRLPYCFRGEKRI